MTEVNLRHHRLTFRKVVVVDGQGYTQYEQAAENMLKKGKFFTEANVDQEDGWVLKSDQYTYNFPLARCGK